MSKFLTSILLGTVFLVSCNKSKDTDEISIESKLLGKWNLKTFVYHNGAEWKTEPYRATDYLEFESGGKLTAKVSDEFSYSTWDLLDEGKTLFILDNGVLDVPENGYEIKTLTGSNLQLYANVPGGSAEQGMTINLDR